MENCRIVLPYRVRTVLQEQGKCVTYSISQVRRGVGIGGCSSLGFVAKAVQ